MKHLIAICALLLLTTWIIIPVVAQNEDTDDVVDQAASTPENNGKPTRPHFESGWLIENQTCVVPAKKTLEFMIQHRFGAINSGAKDLWGIYLPSNIRMGFAYTLWDNVGFGVFKGPIALGYGTTKNDRMHDFSLKYGLLQQTRDSKIPVSLTYFGNMAIASEKDTEELPNGKGSDRLSYFHQLIISRKFSSRLSLQVAPSLSHYNVVDPLMSNDHYAVAVGGRFKFSPQMSIMVNVDQPLTKHEYFNPQPNVSVGIGIATSSHAFQIFVTNYQSIVPQQNNVYNQNDPTSKGYLIGFNINRTWNF